MMVGVKEEFPLVVNAEHTIIGLVVPFILESLGSDETDWKVGEAEDITPSERNDISE